MKVLYITGMYPTPTFPQQGVFCHQQVKALMKLGVDVSVVVPIPFYDRKVRVKEWVYEGVKIQYIRFFKLPGSRDFHRIGKNLYYVLKRTLKLDSYDLYHADSPLPAGYAVMRASEKYKIPFVVHAHGLDVFMDVDYAATKNCQKIVQMCKSVYCKANAVVGVSQKVIDKITERLNIETKCSVVYNGVDPKEFYPAEKKNNKMKIISIGNLIDLKGHDLTIQAISQLVSLGAEELSLDIYGRGEKEEELKQLVKQLHLENYITFRGYVPYQNIAENLRKSDLFVLPSWYEAIGCVYLESMASGVVTVGCRENGIDEIICNGKNGYLVEPHNVDDLVNIIKQVYDDFQNGNAENQKIAEEGRRTIKEHYTWKHSGETLLNVYYGAIGDS